MVGVPGFLPVLIGRNPVAFPVQSIGEIFPQGGFVIHNGNMLHEEYFSMFDQADPF
jgi:hypothetical protein